MNILKERFDVAKNYLVDDIINRVGKADTKYYMPDRCDSEKDFEEDLMRLITNEFKRRDIKELVIACVGTDRVIGDLVGPLVGSELIKKYNTPVSVVGSVQRPMHAMNMQTMVDVHKLKDKDKLVIAVDASVGEIDYIGMVGLYKGALVPGVGVGKNDLCEIGDITITGIVTSSSSMVGILSKGIRFSVVHKISEWIAQRLDNVARECLIEEGTKQ